MSSYKKNSPTLKEKLMEMIAEPSYRALAKRDRDAALNKLSGIYNSYRDLAWEQMKKEPGMGRIQSLEDAAAKKTPMPLQTILSQ